MKLNAECILCLLKRHIATAETVGTEDQVTAFARDLMTMMADGPEEQSAPWYTPEITRLFTQHFGLADDRYAEEKECSNRFFLEREDTRPHVVLTYFREDDRKGGGAYLRINGRVRKLDICQGRLLLEDGTAVDILQLRDIELL